MLFTPAYQTTLREMHAAGPWGNKGHRYYGHVARFYDDLAATSILDYGCGREFLRAAFELNRPGVPVRGYDPGIAGLDVMPEPADLVVCTDVLEHVEPALLDNVLVDLAGLARKGIYLHIALNQAKRILPDGRDAHLIVQGVTWWTDRVARALAGFRIVETAPGIKTLKLWLVR